jgi:hypothetical protein
VTNIYTSKTEADTMRKAYFQEGETRNIYRVLIWLLLGQRQLRKVLNTLKGGGGDCENGGREKQVIIGNLY